MTFLHKETFKRNKAHFYLIRFSLTEIALMKCKVYRKSQNEINGIFFINIYNKICSLIGRMNIENVPYLYQYTKSLSAR